jgi:hypothetical protein
MAINGSLQVHTHHQFTDHFQDGRGSNQEAWIIIFATVYNPPLGIANIFSEGKAA